MKTIPNGKSSKKPLSTTCSSANSRQTEFETSWTKGLRYDNNRLWRFKMSLGSAFSVRPLVLCYSKVLWPACSEVGCTLHSLFGNRVGCMTDDNTEKLVPKKNPASIIRYGFVLSKIDRAQRWVANWQHKPLTFNYTATGYKTTTNNSREIRSIVNLNNLQNKNQQKKNCDKIMKPPEKTLIWYSCIVNKSVFELPHVCWQMSTSVLSVCVLVAA